MTTPEALNALADRGMPMWRPATEQPVGGWYLTYREGEDGCNIVQRIQPDEWADCDGATTVTHSTFLPPTHYLASQNLLHVLRGFIRDGVCRQSAAALRARAADMQA